MSATVTLDYELGSLTFLDQILIHGTSGPFSDYGDSGALVVDVGSDARPVYLSAETPSLPRPTTSTTC